MGVLKQPPYTCDSGVVPSPPPPPAPPGAMNVLYILVDDLRTQLNQSFGHAFMHTPNLDAFATDRHSLVFTRAYCNSQMCVPTRNSFMTGRRPPVTEVFNDGIGVQSFRTSSNNGKNWTSLPGHFKESGWFTTGVGKTFHPNSPPNFDQPMSWSDPVDFPYFYPNPTSCEDGLVWCAVQNSSATFEDLEILAEAKRRMGLAASMGRPFFLNVGFHKPHTPYRSPQRFFDLYPKEVAVAKYPDFPPTPGDNVTGLSWFSCLAEGASYPIDHRHPYNVSVQQELRRAYYASVSFTDENIGLLLQHLNDLGLANNTIVVFHADHGFDLNSARHAIATPNSCLTRLFF